MKTLNNAKGESYTVFNPQYDIEKRKIESFLREFKSNDDEVDKKYGKKKIYDINAKNCQQRTLNFRNLY